MKRQLHALLAVWTSLAIVVSGCAPTQPYFFFEDGDLSHYVGMATNIEHPDVQTATLAEVENTLQPLTVTDPKYAEIWELSLEEAVRITLENSKVMRTLGGRQASFGGQRPQQDESPENLTRAPQSIPTVYDPAISESDPNFGVEGALSAFDAQLGSQLFWEKNDRAQNIDPARLGQLEQFGFSRVRVQDLGQFNATLSKRTVTGGRVAVAANTVYDLNNSGARETPQDWTQNFEVQGSHPLLQGAGIFYNRIAGPFDPFNGTGNPNFDGVLIARIRTDVSLADFEAGVRNLLSDVESAYWNLYFGYRNLEARKVGRDSALATWRRVKALYDEQAKGGEADKEAQAREQFFFFRSEVETALSDLFRAENRLRYVMGLAATDGRLIAPSTEPTTARVTFDWHDVHSESLVRNVELRQQRWRIKQRELELMASKNLLLPRLDVVGRYRWLGLGDTLLNPDGRPFTGSDVDTLVGADAFSSLTAGNFQESQVGLQFNMPLGFRRELATVRNQQLLLARERALLQDQELELSHQLTEAVRVLDTSYTLMQSNFNRAVAAQRQVEAVQVAYETGTVTLDLLLDAQRRLADALSAGYRAQTDYNRNIAQVHLRKGSLLEYNGVYLAEGPWPNKAYFDAHKRARARDAAYFLNYGFTRPDVISRGPIDHNGAAGLIDGGEIHGEQVIEGPIGPEGPALPGEPIPMAPSAVPEEMPLPGPASMKPRANGGKVSDKQEPSAARRVSYEATSESGSSTGNTATIKSTKTGRFDWNLRKLKASSDGAAVEGPALTPDGRQANAGRIRLTAGESDESDADRRADAGGWKRAER